MAPQTVTLTKTASTWTVPSGVSSIQVKCVGGGQIVKGNPEPGPGPRDTGSSKGGILTATMSVSPGEVFRLDIFDNAPAWGPNSGSVLTQDSLWMIAGAGGYCGYYYKWGDDKIFTASNGGDGGGDTGGTGTGGTFDQGGIYESTNTGGSGGTQTQGGSPGTGSSAKGNDYICYEDKPIYTPQAFPGTALYGGKGGFTRCGEGPCGACCQYVGGKGGGGWFGGGGGPSYSAYWATNVQPGGGGGGSSKAKIPSERNPQVLENSRGTAVAGAAPFVEITYNVIEPATTLVNQAGSWKEVKGMHVRDGGSWKEVKEVWEKKNGAWVKGYTKRG